ncbi:MAG: hypothetical protein LBS17_04340 [Actinomycetes bacterium]|jgi:hypothetical protein|nr:hypothetical protein [Actinomycetes bacterium]
MQYHFTVDTPIEESVDGAIRRVKDRREYADALGASSRRIREYASCVILELARRDASLVSDFADAIADALDRPETQTRYNMLEAIRLLCPVQAKVVDGAYDAIEDCLYDEDSATVRLYAFQVFTCYGATTAARSKRVWPTIAAALRCYHGDAEFIPMVNELLAMLEGKVDQSVKEGATELFAFDAENGKGLLARKAQAVIAYAPEVIERLKREAALAEAQKAEAAARKAAEADAAAADEDDDEEIEDE